MDLPSRPNTQRRGSVLLLLIYYLHDFSQPVGPCAARVFFLILLSSLSSGAKLALMRIANEDIGDGGNVFVCVIHVVYRKPGFSVSKRISFECSKRIFLFGHL